jgi:hypothetical protein
MERHPFSYFLLMWALFLLLDVSAAENVMTVAAGGITGADLHRRPLTVVFETDANPTVALAVLYKLRTASVPAIKWKKDNVILRSGPIKLVFRFDPSRKLYLQSNIGLLLTDIQARGSLVLAESNPDAIFALKALYSETYRRIR